MERVLVFFVRVAWKLFGMDRVECLKQLSIYANGDMLPFAYHQRGILKFRETESGERHFIESVLPKCFEGRIQVLDVGANVGDYCCLIHQTFPEAKIVAFEPNPNLLPELNRNVGEFSLVVGSAVGAEEGEVELFNSAAPNASEHGSIHRDVLSTIHQYSEIEATPVPMVALGSYLVEHDIESVDLLKIDTEGHEFDVLRGCLDQLNARAIRIIQFEFNEMNIISRVYLKDFFDLLPSYDFYRMDTDGLRKLAYHPREEIFQFQNLVAVLKEDSSATVLRELSIDGV